MGLAMPLHILRGEANVTVMHVIVVARGIFVAWGRLKNAPSRLVHERRYRWLARRSARRPT
jgi:hypothetical protein